MEVHVFSGLGSSWLPSLRTGTTRLEALIDTHMRSVPVDAKHHIWNDWPSVARDIITRERRGKAMGPIALIGHSNGVLACANIAKKLNEGGIAVSYIAAIDPTLASFPDIGPNVLKVDEFWATSGGVAMGRRWLGKGKCKIIDPSRTAYRTFIVRKNHVQSAEDREVHLRILQSVKELAA